MPRTCGPQEALTSPPWGPACSRPKPGTSREGVVSLGVGWRKGRGALGCLGSRGRRCPGVWVRRGGGLSVGRRACSDRGPPQVPVGSGALGLRAPCPAVVASGTAPEAAARTALWTSPPVACSPVQVRAALGTYLVYRAPASVLLSHLTPGPINLSLLPQGPLSLTRAAL